MTAKPCFGHPSRSAAVLAFRSAGMTTRQIADKIGIADATVTALEHSALRSTKRATRPSEQHGRTILFPRDLLASLGPHAARRGIHPNSLARLIVQTVVDDGLVDSVLDDLADLEGDKWSEVPG